MGLFSALLGCGQNNNIEQNTSSLKLEDITSRTDTSEGFSDIFLTITSDLKTDKSHIYIGKGLYKGKTIGLEFELTSNIPYGITSDGEVNSKSGFVRNGVKFTSIGQETDDLLKALAELYNVRTEKTFSKNKISATVFSLNQKEADLDKGDYYKFKLFFNEDGDEESYGELYLNLNTIEKIIELHEKDPEYRKPLIKVLTE